MIIIKDFKVTDNGKWLVIRLNANTETFPNAYIKSLQISCDGSFTDSATSVFDAFIAEQVDFSSNPTEINITIDIDSFTGPFYMLVGADGEESTTCAYKSTIEVVTFYKYPLYKALACMANQLDGCEPPQYFIDYLLRLKALEASISVLDTEKINYFYKWFILQGGQVSIPTGPRVERIRKPCGCGK